MNIMDIAEAVAPGIKTETIGIRPGEKMHEQMIGVEDAAYTYEYKDHYKILPNIYDASLDPLRIKDGIKVNADFSYTSDNNKEWMSKDDLQSWLKLNPETL